MIFNFRKDKQFLPKLQDIRYVYIDGKHIEVMRVLSEKYCHSLTSLEIKFYELTAEELNTCLILLAKMENLRSLELSIDCKSGDHKPIDQLLQHLFRNCVRIKNFQFWVNNDRLIGDRFFTVLSHLKAIERLGLRFCATKTIETNAKVFKNCPKLRDLMIDYAEVSEELLRGIHSHIPNLSSLEIHTKRRMSDQLFASLSSMKNLQKVFLSSSDPIKEFYYNKSLKNFEDKNALILLDPNCGMVDYTSHDYDEYY